MSEVPAVKFMLQKLWQKSFYFPESRFLMIFETIRTKRWNEMRTFLMKKTVIKKFEPEIKNLEEINGAWMHGMDSEMDWNRFNKATKSSWFQVGIVAWWHSGTVTYLLSTRPLSWNKPYFWPAKWKTSNLKSSLGSTFPLIFIPIQWLSKNNFNKT